MIRSLFKSSNRSLSTRANEYVATVQGYAAGFKEPKPKQRFYKKEYEKIGLNMTKKELGRKKFQIMEYNSEEDSLQKPYSQYPKKRFRQQLSELRLKYKAELAEKELNKRILQKEKIEELKVKEDNIDKYRNKKVKEYNEILEQDIQSFIHIEDQIFKDKPEINKKEKLELHHQDVKALRKKRREQLFEAKKLTRQTQLLKLFYMAEKFVTSDNIDQVIDLAHEAPISTSKDIEFINVIERQNQICDVMNDTLDGKPGVKALLQFHNSQ